MKPSQGPEESLLLEVSAALDQQEVRLDARGLEILRIHIGGLVEGGFLEKAEKLIGPVLSVLRRCGRQSVEFGDMLLLAGSVQRDKGSWESARASYEEAALVFYGLRRTEWGRLARVEWYLGATCEMEGSIREDTDGLVRALKHYQVAERLARQAKRQELLGGIMVRQATVHTKAGAFHLASREIAQSTQAYEQSGQEPTYAYQKSGALALAVGKLDEAFSHVEAAERLLPHHRPLQRAQTAVLKADVLFRMGEVDAAVDVAIDAEEMVNAYGFGHQKKALGRFLDRATK